MDMMQLLKMAGNTKAGLPSFMLGNPAIFIPRRPEGFPSPSHEGFGFIFMDIALRGIFISPTVILINYID